MSKTNNRYDEEFKAHAIKMVVEKGRYISAVSDDLSVSQPIKTRVYAKLSLAA